MFNFIVYEDHRNMSKLCEQVIHNFIGKKRDGYHIVPIFQFNEKTRKQLDSLEGRKIYILDIEVPGKSGLDLAREIRESGDWFSQIIIISAFEHFRFDIFTGKMLALDFISKKENVAKRLRETLELAYDIITPYRFYSFQSNGEILRLPYQDILYFSKNLNDNYTTIVTTKNTYKVKKSILQIERSLGKDLRFLKTHQSCIINLSNVKSVNLADSMINFGGKKTNLLSREHKKELKERLMNS